MVRASETGESGDEASLSAGFNGFPEGLQPVSLASGQTRDQFTANRAAWDASIVVPVKQLIEEVGVGLQETISPSVNAVPKTNGSLSPITRDLRFSADKSLPYKDHLLLNFWEGSPKKHAPTLRLRLSAEDVGFAAGAAFDAAGLARWRETVAGGAGRELLDSLAALGERRDLRYSDPELKNPPKDAPTTSTEQEHLLRHKTFQVRFLEATPSSVTGPAFVPWLTDRLCEFGHIHRWLVHHTQPQAER